jgi:Predicted transcriptional regulators
MSKHTPDTLLRSDKIKAAAHILRALSHPLRLKIISTIEENGGRANVGQIFETLKAEQSLVSQHLRILRQANLVSTKREHKFIFYSLEQEKLAQTANAVMRLLQEF